MLKTLHPALIEFAETELRAIGRSDQEAQDVVQDAYERWLKTSGSYLRDAIRGLIANLDREGRDVMTRHPLSLDQLEEDLM